MEHEFGVDQGFGVGVIARGRTKGGPAHIPPPSLCLCAHSLNPLPPKILSHTQLCLHIQSPPLLYCLLHTAIIWPIVLSKVTFQTQVSLPLIYFRQFYLSDALSAHFATNVPVSQSLLRRVLRHCPSALVAIEGIPLMFFI
jgi:hypothetical protein